MRPAKVIRGDVGCLGAAYRLDVVDDLGSVRRLNEVLVVRLRRRDLVLIESEDVDRCLDARVTIGYVLCGLLLALSVWTVVEARIDPAYAPSGVRSHTLRSPRGSVASSRKTGSADPGATVAVASSARLHRPHAPEKPSLQCPNRWS